MSYKRFREIFHEEGITDEKVIRKKWKISKYFLHPNDLDENELRWSIKEYMLKK